MSYSEKEISIDVQNISKSFKIYEKPNDRLKQFFIPKLRRIFGLSNKNYFKEFCALKDVSFHVEKGQCVGIIGHNGSGKSTLLQIICDTLSPTTGNIVKKGKIAALLELGSGFNPEFTGRENVYLNAMLFGLRIEEIDEKLNDIIEFADIGDFLDKPVKTYSSGMIVRLAFSVIAHVDADLMVIDEALAVGDAVFVQKCMRFIRKFKEKKTLLFVSHDSGSVTNLCDKAIWLDHGVVQEYGDTKDVVDSYLAFNYKKISGQEIKAKKSKISFEEKEIIDIYKTENKIRNNLDNSGFFGTGSAKIESVKFFNSDGEEVVFFSGGEDLLLKIEAMSYIDMDEPIIGFFVNDRLGQNLFGENSLYYTKEFGVVSVENGKKIIGEFYFKMPYLATGKYFVCAAIAEGTQENHIQHNYVHEALMFDVFAKSSVSGLVGIPFQKILLKNGV